MIAILYAAGRGTRLGQKQPKVLVEVGGRSLLDWHVQRLVEAGIGELAIVTGYERAQIAAQLPSLSRKYEIAITEIVNEDFVAGSVLSFLRSLPILSGREEPVLLMDADVFYGRSLLRCLIASPHSTALLIDRHYSTSDDDPVLVPLREGRPFDFRKQWSGSADGVGESVGFFKVSPQDIPLLIEETLQRRSGPARMDSYDEVLRALVLADRFGCEDVTGQPWTEIDFPQDLDRAIAEIFPAIAQQDTKATNE